MEHSDSLLHRTVAIALLASFYPTDFSYITHIAGACIIHLATIRIGSYFINPDILICNRNN